MADEHTYTERHRGIIVRQGMFSWKWTVAREWFGGATWDLKAQGTALTRGGALRCLRRHMGLWFTDRLDRLEIEQVRQHASTAPDRRPAPEPEMLG